MKNYTTTFFLCVNDTEEGNLVSERQQDNSVRFKFKDDSHLYLDDFRFLTKINVFFDDSPFFHNKAVSDGRFKEYKQNLLNILHALENHEKVAKIDLFIISFDNLIDDEILRFIDKSKKARIYQYGNTEAAHRNNFYDGQQTIDELYSLKDENGNPFFNMKFLKERFLRNNEYSAFFRTSQDYRSNIYKDYTDFSKYDSVCVNVYNWLDDFRKEFTKRYSDKRTVFVFDATVTNTLSKEEIDFFNSKDNWHSVSSSREFTSLLEFMKDEIDENGILFDEYVYISPYASTIFTDAKYIDLLPIKKFFKTFSVYSLYYDIHTSAYSFYEFRKLNDYETKKEEEVLTERYRNGVKEVMFYVPEITAANLKAENYNERFIDKTNQEHFVAQEYISEKIEIIPTSFVKIMKEK